MYSNDRRAYRLFFYNAWQKHLNRQLLTPIEAEVIHIIAAHPEYHVLLENKTLCQNQEFEPEENPFIHIGLHQALQEQLRLDKPQGIKQIYVKLQEQYASNSHGIEHQMMDCLAKTIWQAQQSGGTPDESDYLQKLKEL